MYNLKFEDFKLFIKESNELLLEANFEIKNFRLDDISRIIEKDPTLVKGIVELIVVLPPFSQID
jgi:hypothetical protein